MEFGHHYSTCYYIFYLWNTSNHYRVIGHWIPKIGRRAHLNLSYIYPMSEYCIFLSFILVGTFVFVKGNEYPLGKIWQLLTGDPLPKWQEWTKVELGGGTHLSVNVKDLKPQVSCILALSLKKGIFSNFEETYKIDRHIYFRKPLPR